MADPVSLSGSTEGRAALNAVFNSTTHLSRVGLSYLVQARLDISDLKTSPLRRCVALKLVAHSPHGNSVPPAWLVCGSSPKLAYFPKSCSRMMP